MSKTLTTDVLIVGGGPVGLTTAYSLARQGISTLLIEQHHKDQLPIYGRATTLFPRSLELLDLLDLLDPMTQIGFVARNSVRFKDGQRVTERGFHKLFEGMGSTYLDFILNIRQIHSEGVIRGMYEGIAGDGRKYIIGCDGDTSLVRHFANIPFPGESTALKWVRLDGVFKTNMPDSNLGFASIESKNHGNVLWVQLDHGVKRIGFAMTSEMLKKYGGGDGGEMTAEDVKAEAVKAMEPFDLTVERVEWWTLYSIKQCLADTYIANDRILLAGDACHTHSSGAAQGMNTGIHDAVNLAWKLGGVIKGWYTPSILEIYNSERRPAAQRLIGLDKAFSTAISGQIPDSHKGLYADANALLTKLFDETIQFSIGLGVHYKIAPDALVYPPGSHLTVRLYSLLKNTGQWNILLFAGQPSDTTSNLTNAVSELSTFTDSIPKNMLRFVTIIGQNVTEGDKLFAIPRLGYIVFDRDLSAHLKYGVSPGRGAVVVVRPDAILSMAVGLDEMQGIMEFFSGITGKGVPWR